jgi:hypothetical protein
MKTPPFAKLSALPAILAFTFLAALSALAHPGHYHPPGEGDEFDALQAGWLHLHGWWEISFALAAVAAVAVFAFNGNRRVRMAAALAFGGSLALIAAA